VRANSEEEALWKVDTLAVHVDSACVFHVAGSETSSEQLEITVMSNSFGFIKVFAPVINDCSFCKSLTIISGHGKTTNSP